MKLLKDLIFDLYIYQGLKLQEEVKQNYKMYYQQKNPQELEHIQYKVL